MSSQEAQAKTDAPSKIEMQGKTQGNTAMKFYFKKPNSELAQQVLESQRNSEWTYPMAGCTQDIAAHLTNHPGYIADHNRVQLGTGEACFQRAQQAIQKWEMFNLGWVHVADTAAPIEVSTLTGVYATSCGLWSLNVCRIVYVIDETTAFGKRYGFGYGTLPNHVETGEERFTVEWRADDDSVSYDILAFSRPNGWSTRLLYPLVRKLQKKFAKDSKLAMLKDVTQTL